MDILLFFEYPTLCGGEQSMLALVPLLKQAGCRFRAIAPPTGRLAEALAREAIEVLPLLLHEAGIRRPLAECRHELATLVERHRPDVLHANSLSTARVSGPPAANLGVPSIGHLRDIVRLSRAAVADVNRHRRLLAVSRAVRSFHAEQGIDNARMEVLYNGIDTKAFCPRSPTAYLHRELGLPRDRVLVGAIGQVGPRKGFDLALAAGAQIVAACPLAHFLIVGERLSTKEESREFERRLHQAATREPLSGRVHFLGWRDDVADILVELSVLLHPARQEPLGRVLLEAAAAGRPIVATNVGGTREILSDQESARLVPPDDPMAMASAAIALLSNPALATQFGREARNRVSELFRLDESATHLLATYGAAVGSRWQ